jgi:hypothetical protein
MDESKDNADEPVTVTFTRAEMGIVRSVLHTHQGTLTRKQRSLDRKHGQRDEDWIAEKTARNARDSALTESAARKVNRAMWGKS